MRQPSITAGETSSSSCFLLRIRRGYFANTFRGFNPEHLSPGITTCGGKVEEGDTCRNSSTENRCLARCSAMTIARPMVIAHDVGLPRFPTTGLGSPAARSLDHGSHGDYTSLRVQVHRQKVSTQNHDHDS